MSVKIEAILQGGGKISSWIASWQILESVSIITLTTSNFVAKKIVHLTASTSAWRGKVVFAFWEQAKTKSLLQSLATKAKDE